MPTTVTGVGVPRSMALTCVPTAVRGIDISHDDRPVDGGAEAAAGNDTNLGAVTVREFHAFADRGATFGFEADALAFDRSWLSSWPRITLAPGKPPARSPPVRRTFCMAQMSDASTGVVVVEIVAVETEARLRSESRAPSLTGCNIGCAASNALASSFTFGGRHADLKAVRRCSPSASPGTDAREQQAPAGHKVAGTSPVAMPLSAASALGCTARVAQVVAHANRSGRQCAFEVRDVLRLAAAFTTTQVAPGVENHQIIEGCRPLRW